MATPGTKPERIKTPLFRVSFSHVFKPQAAEGSDTEKYSVAAIFSKGTDLKALRQAAFACGKAKFGAKWKSVEGRWPEGFRNPFRKNEEHSDYDGFEPGGTFATLSANLDYPPIVLDKDVSRITATDPDASQKFYSGCWAIATVRPYAYEKTGNKGVAFGLLGIQKQKDDERLGGSGCDLNDFEAVADESDNPDNYGDDDALNESGF
jgi:hypothetical protein